ncbi:MAG: hypothetical protein Q7U04_01205 [Bacteriovorax sp.]|nr:hypothetical protein [Bacteriovorax sp.]
MKKFTFNFSFLDRLRKSKKSEISDSTLSSNDETSISTDFNNGVSAEEFAEKTIDSLSPNENIAQTQASEEIPNAELDSPEASKKFKIKFPQFNRQETSERIRASLAAKSPMNSFEKFSWNDFVLRLFSPYTRGKVHAVFIILFVVVLTYMLGKNMALFLNRAPPIVKASRPSFSMPLEKVDTTLQDINKIASTNLFNAKESDKSSDKTMKKDIDSIICLDANTPTALQIKLLDTIVLQDSVKSVASVQVRGSSELTNVREGERLEEMAEVSKINRMKLILKNLQTGECEYAMTDVENEPLMPNLKIVSAKAGKSLFKSTNPNIKNTGNSFKIKRTFRDSMINNMSDILTQAKAVQITNPDGSLCFKMTEVVAGSLYSQLDIQENDVICNINGKKIDNLNDLMGLLGKIKEIDQFQIGSKRNGMNESKDYSFE